MRGSVAIVIVNWNGRELLDDCFQAVRAQDYSGAFEIVLVDNGSTDGSVEYVRERHGDVRLVESPVNNYAGANNLGIAATQSDYVVCLNTDTRVAPGWLAALVDALEADSDVAAAGSLVVFEDGRVNSAGIELIEGYAWRDRGFEGRVEDHSVACDAYGLTGCSVLYRREVWEQLGGLDEDFHMYYEDVDLSLRARAAGHRLRFVPTSRVEHAYNASIRKLDEDTQDRAKDVLGERNRLYVIARHFPSVLMEQLVSSRFLLHQPEGDVRLGLERILSKWTHPAASTDHDPLLACLIGARLRMLQHEAWARRSQVELRKRDASVRELRAHGERMAEEHASERRSWEGRVRRLEDELSRLGAPLRRSESEALELRGRLVELRRAYELQLQRDREEFARGREAYEREIAHREGVIGGLKSRLDELDAEQAKLRTRADSLQRVCDRLMGELQAARGVKQG